MKKKRVEKKRHGRSMNRPLMPNMTPISCLIEGGGMVGKGRERGSVISLFCCGVYMYLGS